jgi:hypothetical protein
MNRLAATLISCSVIFSAKGAGCSILPARFALQSKAGGQQLGLRYK